MNARLYNRKEEDEQSIGPHCLWREDGYIRAVDARGKTVCKDDSIENRTNFRAVLKAHELRPMNTWFTKPPEKLATYTGNLQGRGRQKHRPLHD